MKMFKLIKKNHKVNNISFDISSICEHPSWLVLSETISDDEEEIQIEARCLICGAVHIKKDDEFIYKYDRLNEKYISNYIKISQLNNFSNLDEETIYNIVKLEYFKWLKEKKEITSNSFGFFEEYSIRTKKK